MKTIIAGSRTFDNGQMVIDTIRDFQNEYGKITEVVSGMAKGADMMGHNFAQIWKIPCKEFPADWASYGKAAGYRRNAEMAAYADALIAFWDGKSKGTKHMIDLAKKYNLKIKIVTF